MRQARTLLSSSSSCKQASKHAQVWELGSVTHSVSHPSILRTLSSHLTFLPSTARPQQVLTQKTDTNPHRAQVGVHRDCFGCGRTCEECKAKYIRTCRFCRAEYCVIDNEGSSETEVCAGCDAPSFRGDILLTMIYSAIGVIRVDGGRGRCLRGPDAEDIHSFADYCDRSELIVIGTLRQRSHKE